MEVNPAQDTRQQAPLALSNLLLLLRQRNRRTCYNFCGLGIEDPFVERTRLCPPIQFFQPPSHLNSVLFTGIAMFTVRMLDFQEGQKVTLQIHDPPRRGIQSIRTMGCCVPRRELIFEAAAYYATRCACGFQQKWVSPCTEIANTLVTLSPTLSSGMHGDREHV